MYVRVYAQSGEPFDVSRERADHLILNCGWTQTPPVSAEELPAPTPKNKHRKPAETEPADAGDDTVTSSED